jgi:protein phosphatase
MKNLKSHAYGCTDIGNIRVKNEDYFIIQDNLFVVTDGVGGSNAGEIASKLAAITIVDILKNVNWEKFNKKYLSIHCIQLIKDAIEKTNQIVYKKSKENESLKDMGTTIVLAVFQEPNFMHLANIGDSRAYLFRDNLLRLLSKDHTFTAKLVDDGVITNEEVRKHPYRNVLTKSIGIKASVEPYHNVIKVEQGDMILLCSDGLWDSLSEDEIILTFQDDLTLEKKCKDLIQKANELDGSDNITVIVISILDNSTK